MFLAIVAVGVQAVVAWGVDLSEMQQAAINAAATLVMGLVIALVVARDQIIPAAGGALGAVLQLLVAFGAHLTQDQIATAGALLTAVLAAWLHGKVTAPVAPDGTRVARQTVYSARRASRM